MARRTKLNGDAWQAEGPLTDALVAALTPPQQGNKIRWHGALAGFGLRITSAGAKAFILRYRNADGRDRTLTIGSPPSWTVAKAVEAAKSLRRRVDVGEDPLEQRQVQRNAPTVDDLADRFEAEHLPKRRPGTAEGYEAILRLYVRPTLGRLKVAEVKFRDIERMHHRIAETAPYAANRTLAVTSKMFNLAVKWSMRPDNPTKGVERSPEHRRERFLSPDEITHLGQVLASHPQRASARAVQLLLLTGARRGEVLGAKWTEFDLASGIWLKPHSNTKQKRDHRLPLSAPAVQLLNQMRTEAAKANGTTAPVYLFPGTGDQPLREIKRFWRSVCDRAGLNGVRLHDLRHTHASILASLGMSLPLIGALLGHTQPATTARYAHLLDDPLRAATERAGAIIAGRSESAVAPEAVERNRHQ